MKYIRKTIQTTTYTYTVNENGVDYHFTDMCEGAPTLYALTKSCTENTTTKTRGVS